MGYPDAPTDARFVPRHPTKVYDQCTTIQHWQLRDLIHAHDERALFCVDQNRTLQYDTVTNTSRVAQTLTFAPTAMTAAHGYVAAGGQSSYLDVQQIGGGECLFRGPIGGSVNNALQIAEDGQGGLRLLVCNNDHTVKLFELPSMRALGSVACPAAVNYAALSPDGQRLAAVGDSCDTHVFRATPSGFVEECTFTEFEDAGMACAWNPAGSCLAAGGQDGQVVVWDPRSRRSVVRMQTVTGACRCIKFGEGPVDLLAFAEHSDYCHLVDTRAFMERQILDLSAGSDYESMLGGDSNVSGLAFTPSGRRLYVGLEAGHGIAAFDVKMLSRLTFSAAQLN